MSLEKFLKSTDERLITHEQEQEIIKFMISDKRFWYSKDMRNQPMNLSPSEDFSHSTTHLGKETIMVFTARFFSPGFEQARQIIEEKFPGITIREISDMGNYAFFTMAIRNVEILEGINQLNFLPPLKLT